MAAAVAAIRENNKRKAEAAQRNAELGIVAPPAVAKPTKLLAREVMEVCGGERSDD